MHDYMDWHENLAPLCEWCGIVINEHDTDMTDDAEELCMDCFAVWCKDRGMTDEGEPLDNG